MQIAGRPQRGFWAWLARWWRKDSAAVVKRAKEIRARELAEAVAEAIWRDTEHNPNAPAAVLTAIRISLLVREIADGRTTLEPNPSQLAKAREELK